MNWWPFRKKTFLAAPQGYKLVDSSLRSAFMTLSDNLTKKIQTDGSLEIDSSGKIGVAISTASGNALSKDPNTGALTVANGTISKNSDGLFVKLNPPKPAGIVLNRYDGQDLTMLVSFTVDGDDDMFFRVNFAYGNGFVLDGQLVGGGSYSINGNNFPPQTGISSATPAIYVFSGLSSGVNMYVAQNGSSIWASQGVDVMFGFGDNANPSGTDNLVIG